MVFSRIHSLCVHSFAARAGINLIDNLQHQLIICKARISCSESLLCNTDEILFKKLLINKKLVKIIISFVLAWFFENKTSKCV